MKKLICLLLLCAAGLLRASAIQPVPDHDFLVKNEFYFSCCGIGGSGLSFLRNSRFISTYNIDGGSLWHNEGNYEIAGTSILLHPVSCRQNKGGDAIDCKKTVGELVCHLEKDDESVFYSLYLTCKPKKPDNQFYKSLKFQYPVKDSEVRAGEMKKVDGVAVITTGKASAVTTSNVKLRAKPSPTAREIEFTLYPDYRSPFVPAKTEITVYARTVDKEKVQNWENYWYYVKAGGAGEAWMFGEFVKLK